METMSLSAMQRERTREPEGSAIDVRRVSKSFANGPVALDGVSLQVRRGEVLGLLGHNGAGKTTLIRLLAGLLQPTSGSVEILGHDPSRDGGLVRRLLGVLPSSGLLDFRLTARENLEFAAALFDLRPELGRARAGDLLEEFDLAARADEPVATFSQGMKQRLGLARVLLPEPEILLLDEPTSALDPVAARDVRSLIRHQSRERDVSVVVCTHDLAEAAEICDRVVILSQGRTIAEGTPAELAARVKVAGGVEVEVDPGDLPRMRAALPAGLVTTTLDETRAEVSAPHHVDVPVMVDALVRAGVRVQAIRPPRATLEDLYLSLHQPTPSSPDSSERLHRQGETA